MVLELELGFRNGGNIRFDDRRLNKQRAVWSASWMVFSYTNSIFSFGLSYCGRGTLGGVCGVAS